MIPTDRAAFIVLATTIFAGSTAWAAERLPHLDIVLSPVSRDGNVTEVNVEQRIEAPALPAMSPLVRMPLRITSIPTPRYDGNALTAFDAAGPLPLTAEDEPKTPSADYRRWLVSRPTVGDVTVRFSAPPRAVDASTRGGPLFDLVAEAGGVSGAGISFLAIPPDEKSFDIRVRFDLSAMPAGSRGIWTFGENDVRHRGSAADLAQSFYMAGPVRSTPPDTTSFGTYWLSEPSFDMQTVAENIRKFYLYASAFFSDEGKAYRVFARKNPYPSGGGTALLQSFMFGYSDAAVPTPASLHALLAHETAHNWPHLSDDDHGATAWYSEGNAEFYSILLSYRAGVYSLEDFEREINKRAYQYYANPLQTLTLAEAGKRFWQDRNAQRVPYGRGFLYLVTVDAKIRKASGGRRSLDDLVKAMTARRAQGQSHGLSQWLEMIAAELGPEGRADYDVMTSGARLLPPQNSFAPCFRPVETVVRQFDLGLAPEFLQPGAMAIAGLAPQSPAAKAGIRNGDVFVSLSRASDAEGNPEATITVKVRRGEQLLDVTYLPRSGPVSGYRWARVEGVPASRCNL